VGYVCTVFFDFLTVRQIALDWQWYVLDSSPSLSTKEERPVLADIKFISDATEYVLLKRIMIGQYLAFLN
jgi:hypothetical protein